MSNRQPKLFTDVYGPHVANIVKAINVAEVNFSTIWVDRLHSIGSTIKL